MSATTALDTSPIWQLDDYLRFTELADARIQAWALRRLCALHPAEAARALPAARRALASDDDALLVAGMDVISLAPPRSATEALQAFVRRGLRWRGLERTARALLERDAGRAGSGAAKRAGAAEAPRPERAPEVLVRELAQLAEADEETASATLEALRGAGERWASAALLARLEPLLCTEHHVEVWDVLQELGDPAALDAALAEWVPGERSAAKTAALLAGLCGREAELPEGLHEDLAAAERDHADLITMVEAFTSRGLGALASHDRPLTLALRCTRCRRVYGYDVPHAVISPKLAQRGARLGADWDGALLWRVITCKRCGAEDSYELTESAREALVIEAAGVGRPPGARTRVEVGEARLWDGTLATRTGAALRHLRALAEAYPQSGEAWRRLGNALERTENLEEAVRTWRCAIEVDEREVEAALSLATRAWRQEPEAAFEPLREAVRRLPRARGEAALRADLTLHLATMLIEAGRRMQPPIVLAAAWQAGAKGSSSVEIIASTMWLADAPDPEVLATFFGMPELLTLDLIFEPPADRLPLLRRFLLEAADRRAARRSPPAARKPGRNDRCPCGSGQKYKRCCGARPGS